MGALCLPRRRASVDPTEAKRRTEGDSRGYQSPAAFDSSAFVSLVALVPGGRGTMLKSLPGSIEEGLGQRHMDEQL